MNSNYLKKLFLFSAKVFLVVFIFIIDVKVHADVVTRSVTGKVEFEKGGQTGQLKNETHLTMPFDLETYANGVAKLSVNSVYLGMGERSLLSFSNSPKIDMSWGSTFIVAPLKSSDWLTIRTPQGVVFSQGGEFIVTVRNSKTSVSVISGEVKISDRSSNFSQLVRPGYSQWLGGLLASGSHAHGRVEACDFDGVMGSLKRLGNFAQGEWQHRYDELRPLWKSAVEDVAQQTQDQVAGDMQILKEVEEADHKREVRHHQEQVRIRKTFRERELGVPDESTTGPSELPRAPASSDE